MRYIVHAHSQKSDGTIYSSWTKTDLGRTTAYRLAREARANGEIARVVPEVRS